MSNIGDYIDSGIAALALVILYKVCIELIKNGRVR